MRKFFVTIAAVCLAVYAWAAEIPAQGVGVQIGWAQPILRLNSPIASYPKDSLVDVTKLNGFKVGLMYDASYIAGFGSTIGVNYTFGAATTPWAAINPGISTHPQAQTLTTYHEMEVFVDWQDKFELAKETYIILYSGPTIQCGLQINTRKDRKELDGTVTKGVETNRFIDQTVNEQLNRINVTWGVGAGFQYKRYFLRGGYDFGLINPYKNDQFENMDRNTRGRLDQWSIKIGAYIWYED